MKKCIAIIAAVIALSASLVGCGTSADQYSSSSQVTKAK
jgi:predicted small lipoprotein YifL